MLLGTLVSVAGLFLGVAPAWGAQARISDVRSADGVVRLVLSADGLAEGQTIDPDSVRVTIGGLDAETSAAPIGEGPVAPKRSVLLTLDTSGSMGEDGKLATAKRAALAYLEGLPADVEAGLVTFADDAEVLVAPTKDRAPVVRAIGRLKAGGATALYDAVVLSVDALGDEGSRAIVLLSDGQDEGSTTSVRQASRTVRQSGVVLDAVSLGTGRQEAQLAALARAGGGSTVTATDAASLVQAFESAARTVDTQLGVQATVPGGLGAGTVAVVVTAAVGRETITDQAVALLTAPTPGEADLEAYGPVPVAEHTRGIVGQSWFLVATVGLVFVGLTGISAFALGAVDAKNRSRGRISRRLSEVSIPGATTPAGVPSAPQTVLGENATVRMAVSFADRVAAGRDTTAIVRKLEAANVALRPGEWVVVHALFAVLTVLLATVLSNFNPFVAILAFALGLALPWMYLSYRGDRRAKRFYEALPDSMQMLAGSLSAGYSLPQALNNVAREAGGPISEELNRALLETRLGMPLEEALEAVAQRVQSEDFHWVVMTVRINRQVGGNLAEVLTNVARTIRERERLRRQVKALSAEGVLSAWILGLLPIGIGAFVALTRPAYLAPLFTTTMGLVMVALGLLAYIVGIVWMRNLVRIEI